MGFNELRHRISEFIANRKVYYTINAVNGNANLPNSGGFLLKKNISMGKDICSSC
jgi:hypothetical protein